MTSTPCVSVIVPAFNAGAFLEETLNSVLNQTLPASEIIVIDDGSVDNTPEIAQKYGPAVTLLRGAKAGAAAARNLGASRAKGNWLAFLDADDVWMPTKLERQAAQIDDATVLVYCDRLNIGDRGDLPEVQSTIQPLCEGDVFLALLLGGNVITTSGVALRSDVFQQLGGFCEDPGLLPAEDWDLWLRVAASHEIRACREPLIHYRLHAGGISRRLRQMMAARCLVVARALASPRGRALSRRVQRRIWSATWRTNGDDAVRRGATATALSGYARAVWYAPLAPAAYIDIARVMLGRLR